MNFPIVIIDKEKKTREIVTGPTSFKTTLKYSYPVVKSREIPNPDFDETKEISTENPEYVSEAYVETETAEDEITHPSETWSTYTSEDWQEKCPTWEFYTVDTETVVVPEDKLAVRNDADIAAWKVNTKTKTIKPTFTFVDDPNTQTLEQVKANLLSTVDAQAEYVRMQHLTPGTGQAVEYDRTLTEALKAKSLDPQTIVESDFPWLLAELNALRASGSTATFQDVVDSVIAQAEAWTTLGTKIKEKRRTAKLKIASALTKQEANSVLPINWLE